MRAVSAAGQGKREPALPAGEPSLVRCGLLPLSRREPLAVSELALPRVEFALRPTAVRYEGGSQNMCGVLALGGSLDMLSDLGLGPRSSPIAARVLEITDYACRRLSDIGAEIVSQREGDHRSGIVAFTLPGRDLQEERKRCLASHVVLSYRGGCLRVSPHGYASEEDIEHLIDVLKQGAK